MSVIRTRVSTTNIESTKLDREVARNLFRQQPSAVPMTLLLNAAKKKRRKIKSNLKFEHFEKTPHARTTQINGASFDTTTILLTVDDATIFSMFEVVKVIATGEHVRVTSIPSATVIGIARAQAGTTVGALADNGVLLRMGTAHPQGGSKQQPNMKTVDNDYNYPQIFRRSYGVTGTMKKLETLLGDDMTERGMDEAYEQAVDMEHAFIHGKRYLDQTDTGQPIYYTGGFIEKNSTNVINIAGTMTETVWFTKLAQLFRYGSDMKILLASSTLLNTLVAYPRGRMTGGIEGKVNLGGLTLEKYESPHGTLLIRKHKLLEGSYDGYGLMIDMDNIQFAYVPGRDNLHREDIQNNGDDAHENEWLSEVGLDLWGEYTHGVIYGVTGPA